jgi:hypothetical protein
MSATFFCHNNLYSLTLVFVLVSFKQPAVHGYALSLSATQNAKTKKLTPFCSIHNNRDSGRFSTNEDTEEANSELVDVMKRVCGGRVDGAVSTGTVSIYHTTFD